MKTAILGVGHVGGALARLWSQNGHEVLLAARTSEKAKSLESKFSGCRAVTAAELSKASVIALCVPWPSAQDALQSVGNLRGKIIVDCTNPLNQNATALAVGGIDSAGEQIQRWFPQASVVKAFNTLGAMLLGNADFHGQLADGFYCGDDSDAKSAVAPLIKDSGLHPLDVGPLRNARYLEAMAMLWIDMTLYQKRGGNYAFKLISR
jgi:predicted dinucleotide-binding enzyme